MRALVLSVGGDLGGYQAGVVSRLLEMGHRWDAFFGSSAGALNAALCAQYTDNEADKLSEHLQNAWLSVKRSDFVSPWKPFSILHGLWSPSLYSTGSLAKLLSLHVSPKKLKESGKTLGVAATEIYSGESRSFDQSHPEILKAIRASSAFPVMFEPVPMDGGLWADGGLRSMSPAGNALACGANEIDVVLCSSRKEKTTGRRKPNAVEMATRSLSLLMDEAMDRELEILDLRQRLSFATTGDLLGQDFHFRVLRPDSPLPGGDLKFDGKNIKECIKRGREDAAVWA